jgi:hypothetical protein
VHLRLTTEEETIMTGEPPIACTLSEPELREREQTVLAAVRNHVRNVVARADGYAVELEPSDEAIAAATMLIRVERRCCRFVRFALTVEPDGRGVELVLTGSAGTREFLATWLEPSEVG